MNNHYSRCFILLFFTCFFYTVNSQTLIINEVSNGSAGNQEYVEFVVVSNAVTYDCNSPNPPCIDIRGWIFDDNSGYHGTSGVAVGAVRFSQDLIWSCIPLGTIILIYNNADMNPAIPPDDLSMVDGNCTIIAPMNSALFESNATTPGAVACSYPATGWTPGGNWNNTLLANAGDCARIVDLAGCEVFSLCWSTDNLNNLIYFNSGGSGTQNVWYFNDGDPAVQANWTEGSASLSPDNQTPGAPNNAANAAYIAQFNNGCLPITPIIVTATSVNAGCTCTGTATASASGSIPGYTYAWYNSVFVPIGQTTATATSLCAGTYNVIATSSIGCTDTATVTITSTALSTVSVNSQTICSTATTTLTATPSVSGGTYAWTPGGQTTQTISINPSSTTTYTVTYTLSGCSSTGSGIVTVNPLPIVTVNSPTICAGQSATLTASGAATYSWNTGSTLNPLTVSPISTTSYTVTGTSLSCSSTAIATVTVNPLPIVAVNSPTICEGQSATLTASGAATYSWSIGSALNPLTVSPTSTTSYTVTGTSLSCSSTAIATVTVNPLPIVTVNSPTICEGQSTTLTASGAATYSWNTGSTLNPLTVSPTTTTSYTVTGTSLSCSSTAIATITVNPLPIVTVNSLTICEGQSATLTASGAATYSWNTGSILNPLTVSPATTTSYTVTGTSLSCSSAAIATVTVNPLPIVTVNSPTICPGTTANLLAGGASTYTWSTGATTTGVNTADASPSITTTYTVTGTSVGCTSTAVATVSVATTLVVTVNSPAICNGATANLTAAGATTYTWSAGATTTGVNTADASPTTTMTYTVTGTSAGCTGTAVATVTVNSIPVTTVNSPTICAGQTATLTAAGATTYTWTAGATSTGVTTADVSPLVTTTYTVTGTSVGCSSSAVATVTVDPIPVITVSSATICPGGTANLIAGGAATYTWSAGATSTGVDTADAAPAVTTTYTVTGTSLGCSSTAVSTVTVASALVPDAGINDTVCYGASTTLSVMPNGVGYTYAWLPAAGLSDPTIFNPIANPTATTDYTVTVIATGGCSGSDIIQVFVDPRITLSVAGIAATCNSVCDGQTIVIPGGGTPTFTYLWSSGCTSAACTSSCTGSYTVTVTDALGCTADTSVTVAEPSAIILVMSSTIANCNLPDGSATVIASGGTPGAGGVYSYLWPDGQTTATALNLVPGSYCVLVTDANGCTKTACVTVPNASGVVAFIASQTNASCNGLCDGSATAAGAGGVGSYSYSWNTVPVQTAITATNLCAGTYTVTVSEPSGCTDTIAVTITEPTLVVIAPIADITICDAGTAALNALASGGNGIPYSYSWLPVGTGSSASVVVTPAATTVYTVNATDVNGCPSAPEFVMVTVGSPLTVDATSDTSICLGSVATISAIANNGNGGSYTYSWMPGVMPGNSVTVTPGVTTTYTVTANDGCSSAVTDSVTVTILPSPNVVFNSNVTSGCVPLCVNFSDSSTAAGDTISSWSWNFNDGPVDVNQNPTHCFTNAGSYDISLTVISAAGCTSSITNADMITVYPIPEAAFTAPLSSSIIDPVVNFTNNSIGASQWNWDFGDSLDLSNNSSSLQNPAHRYSEVGAYCVTLIVTSPAGCVDATTLCVVIDEEFTFYAPNAFTPNDDSDNEIFLPIGTGWDPDKYRLYIFDRWGNLCFSADDMNKGWNGKANLGNIVAQIDTYIWKVELMDVFGKRHNYIGKITIVK